jgi:phosphoribosylformimino-5-aminoimidazole carboxamide ribotide isomerase
MRVIGVVDLRAGRAVHALSAAADAPAAVAEQARRAYLPVEQAAGRRVGGKPLALTRVYVETLGVREVYVADLDAILDGVPPSPLVRDIAQIGAPLWLDAAVSSVGSALHAIEFGASQLVVGLETLDSYKTLTAICQAVGRDRVAFSLDLRHGDPRIRAGSSVARERPKLIAARAAAAGATAVIVLDLARVGQEAGVDLDLIEQVRREIPGVTLLAGGGVRDTGDLRRLAARGCDGALVATALHDGRISAADLEALPRSDHGNVTR